VSQLHAEAEGFTVADPEVVWALLADANSYSSWGPWSDSGYQPASEGPSRVGSVQWFRYGRRTMSVEKILEVEERRLLAYTVVHGLPVRNYWAEVTLTPVTSGGTSVRWTADWDRTLLGRAIHRRLQKVYHQVMTALITAADHEDARSRHE
jgi:uncharacterized protein YndB with AHSA1/START domain